MTEPLRDPYSALRHAGYRRFLVGNFLANVGRQAVSVAATWQIYQWTHSATALGLVGLVNVIPLLTFVLPAGVWADRIDRRRIISRCLIASAVLSLALAVVTQLHDAIPPTALLRSANHALRGVALVFERHVDPAALDFTNPALPIVYALLFVHAIVRVVAGPARGAIVPQLVPASALSNAVTWSSSLFELSTVIGPALGGAIVAWSSYTFVYVFDVLCALALVFALLGVKLPPGAGTATRSATPGMFAGVQFIGRHPAILGALALDLFAVVLGGAVALLPIYAHEILQVGPAVLGWLRAAPSLGAITMAFVVAHRRPFAQPGLVMLWSVAGFGAAVTLFSFSTALWLSLAALFLSGACDNVSVVIRHSVVQLLTPDALRGRVTSVNQLFIGCSNEISALRAGLMAALFGPVVAASAGGAGTIAVTVAAALIWPALRALPPLARLVPAASAPEKKNN